MAPYNPSQLHLIARQRMDVAAPGQATHQHRPEINGLRALAVLPVILFHAGYEGFSGGFVGVDVFFVISGFLITGIIVADVRDGRFSLLEFYERRARRILPALFVVMAATIPFAWLWLLPHDMVDFGESLAAAASFSSNILFWVESDYFASDANLKPLLHTWSLAVEEQFYLIFPLALLLVLRLRKAWVLVVLAAAFAASLILAQWGALNKPTPTFYLLPTRGFELLIGALLAIWMAGRRGILGSHLGSTVAAIGLCCIISSILVFDAQTPVPGFAALLPTLGTAAVILGCSEQSPVTRLLSIWPLEQLGLISYSAYLWHQPLLALQHYQFPIGPPMWLTLLTTAAVLPLAWFTWRFVETPWRDRGRWSRKTVFTSSLAGIGLFVIFGLGLRAGAGLPERLPQNVQQLEQLIVDHETLRDDGGCNLNRDTTKLPGCIKGARVAPRIGLVGDSHAASIAPVLADMLAEQGLSFVQYTKLGCPFGPGIDSTEGFRCAEFFENTVADIDRRKLDQVIVMSRWSYYLHDTGFDNGLGGVEYHDGKRYSTAAVDFSAPLAERQSALLDAYRQGIERIADAGHEVLLILPLPEQGWNVPRMLARLDSEGATEGRTAIPPLPLTLWQARHAEVLNTFGALGKHPMIHLHDPTGEFCTATAGGCMALLNGEPLYYDDDHPSLAGSRLLLESMHELNIGQGSRTENVALSRGTASL